MNNLSSHKRPRLSPLRYPGGKSAMYPLFRELIRSNRLSDCIYVEPFAGGAGAAVSLLITGEVDQIVINDLDPAIFTFWNIVVEQPERLEQFILDVPLTIEEWKRQKAIYRSMDRGSFELGCATFYLNRTNRSGVLNAGPIGGLAQQGAYRIDARFNRKALTERVRLIRMYRHKVVVRGSNGNQIIREFADGRESMIFADPPYFNKSGSLYMNKFSLQEHEELSRVLNEISWSKWILTYDDVAVISDLYWDRRKVKMSTSYSANKHVKSSELVMFSDGMDLDSVESIFAIGSEAAQIEPRSDRS